MIRGLLGIKEMSKLVFFEHSVRLYKLDGLKSLLNKSGFAIKEVYGGYEGEKFSSNSPRLILLAKTK